MPKNKLFTLLAIVTVFVLSLGGSFWLFQNTASSPSDSPSITDNTVSPTASKKSKIDPSIPRTEVCPLNGAMFTKQEKDVWVTRRPMAVMVENSPDARPQSGMATADIVYEAVAEGGITRFMGMFYCNAALAGNIPIAPVRSARIYYVNIMSEYDPLYVHVGGAGNCDDPNVDPRAKALCVLHTASNNTKDLDQMGRAGDFKTCHRMANRLDREVAYEHTMACFLDELYAAGVKWGWSNVDSKGVSWDKNFIPWKFNTTTTKAEGTPATDISYTFWGTNRDFNKAFDVNWKYDQASSSYARYNGGVQSIDLNSDESLKFTNVVVQYAKETSLGDLERHMLYDVIGTNKATYFIDGVRFEGTWAKASRTGRTIFKDSKGKEVLFRPGPIWISILPQTNEVTSN